MNRAMAKAKLFAERAHPLYPEAEIWLYGSYAKGTATEASDIDIAVVFPPKTSSSLELMPIVRALNEIANEIDCGMEPFAFEYGDAFGFVEMSVVPYGIRLA